MYDYALTVQFMSMPWWFGIPRGLYTCHWITTSSLTPFIVFDHQMVANDWLSKQAIIEL